ncbi:hypothetical protein CI102_14153 [Trichoderma harzianum]|uniref:Secreted protein n=1 Tax=Trichoderma harzianum CBS 226.95 TaxID=983964 RepID=A0A2T4A2L6_TRIHA|nr:hypothetical protein M431DRAFT_239281 [Trichoderma harzianum CBS 226.95]PKK41007.1 hypothetical protein CI102_14153 [Trichoderma harzianum]PTB51311.1 hypothetical protein M431DRAFT_239281 [Trichoderma harzianum CBS 226.95]
MTSSVSHRAALISIVTLLMLPSSHLDCLLKAKSQNKTVLIVNTTGNPRLRSRSLRRPAPFLPTSSVAAWWSVGMVAAAHRADCTLLFAVPQSCQLTSVISNCLEHIFSRLINMGPVSITMGLRTTH